MRFAIPFVLIAAILAGAAPVWAQSADMRAIYTRLDRLERDLQSLQAQLARGGTNLVVTSPAAANPSNGAVGGAAVGISDRLDRLEAQVQELTGRLEEVGHNATQTASQLDRMQADIDLRFKEVQQSIQALQPQTAAAQPPADTGAPATPEAKAPPVPSNSAENPGLAPGPQVLGQISDKDLKRTAAAQPSQPPAPKDPKAAYDAAFALYQSHDYAGAGDAFKAFLAKHPDHQLAANAMFWQAESAYQQKDYRQAVAIYADAYKKYPNSTKASDMLYKMGASFNQLNMSKEACRAYKLLFEEHPDMPDRVRKAATADKTKLGC